MANYDVNIKRPGQSWTKVTVQGSCSVSAQRNAKAQFGATNASAGILKWK